MLVKVRDESQLDDLKLPGILSLIKEELNIKQVSVMEDVNQYLSYNIKPRYDLLGPKLGKSMSKVVKAIQAADPSGIKARLDAEGKVVFDIDGQDLEISAEELEVKAEDREGYCVESDNGYYVALDTTITPELELEGLARELVSKIQNMRKDAGFEVEDKITLYYKGDEKINRVFEAFGDTIASEVLAINTVNSTPEEKAYAKEWSINGYKATLGVMR
jgi:isoleucyl-tRNA synthetase